MPPRHLSGPKVYFWQKSEVRGSGAAPATGKSAFVFVRAMRACERAKLCVGALDNGSPTARLGELKMLSGAGVPSAWCLTLCEHLEV